jgi:hypothetical protein
MIAATASLGSAGGTITLGLSAILPQSLPMLPIAFEMPDVYRQSPIQIYVEVPL